MEMECPLSLGFWERDDGHIVCLDQTCTLDDVDKDDLGFYECGLGLYGLVMAVGEGMICALYKYNNYNPISLHSLLAN